MHTWATITIISQGATVRLSIWHKQCDAIMRRTAKRSRVRSYGHFKLMMPPPTGYLDIGSIRVHTNIVDLSCEQRADGGAGVSSYLKEGLCEAVPPTGGQMRDA